MRDELISATAPGRDEKPPATTLVRFVIKSTRVTRLAGSRSATNKEVSPASSNVRKNGATNPLAITVADPSLSRIFRICPDGEVCSDTYAYCPSSVTTKPTALFSVTAIAVFTPLVRLIWYKWPLAAYSTT